MKTDRFICLYLSVIICGSFVLFYRLGDRELWSSHEARGAQDAQTILDSDDWILPRLFDGSPELQKPPLYYWLVAGFGWLNGGQVDALTERLPAALAAIGTALILMLAFRAKGRPLAGILAALVLITAQHFTWIGRTGRIDVPLVFTVTAAVLGLRSSARVSHFVGYLAIAAGVMLKGPLGVVLPFAILASAVLLRPRNDKSGVSPVIPPSVLWGIPLVLALTAPWFVAVHLRTDGEFTRVFFWHHHVERATGVAKTLATHPWWFYLARWAVDTLPWTPFVVVAGYVAWRSSWLRHDLDARLGFAWMLAVTLLLSLSRFKRADYLLPAYPGLAIALGCLGERAYHSHRFAFRAKWVNTAVLSTCGLAVITWTILLHTLIPRLDAERAKRAFAEEIRKAAPAPRRFYSSASKTTCWPGTWAGR